MLFTSDGEDADPNGYSVYGLQHRHESHMIGNNNPGNSHISSMSTLMNRNSMHMMDTSHMLASQSRRAESSIWEMKYQALLRFGEEKGHYNCPQKYKCILSNGTTVCLGKWLSSQRCERKKGCLLQERLVKLQALSDQGKFEWEPIEQDARRWQMRFDALLDFAKSNGHCSLPKNMTISLPDGSTTNLFNWLAGELSLKRKKKLRPERESLFETQLVAPGYLKWYKKHESDEEIWETKYHTLLWYGEQFGHYNVPDNFKCVSADGNEVKLGCWLQYQRGERRRKKLRPDREQKLQKLVDTGKLAWDIVKCNDVDPWDTKYQALLSYCNEHGTCNVPDSFKYDDGRGKPIRLGRWLGKQRRGKKIGKLRKDREALLQKLVDEGKLLWEILNSDITMKSWEMKFHALWAYGSVFGTCDVPKNAIIILDNGREVKLGQWLFLQKTLKKQGKLKLDRELKLQRLVDDGKMTWETEHPSLELGSMYPSQAVRLPPFFAANTSNSASIPSTNTASSVMWRGSNLGKDEVNGSLDYGNVPSIGMNMGIVNPRPAIFFNSNQNISHHFGVNMPNNMTSMPSLGQSSNPMGIVIYPVQHSAPVNINNGQDGEKSSDGSCDLSNGSKDNMPMGSTVILGNQLDPSVSIPLHISNANFPHNGPLIPMVCISQQELVQLLFFSKCISLFCFLGSNGNAAFSSFLFVKSSGK